MYKLTHGRGAERMTKYFITLAEAKNYCRWLCLNPRCIKPVH